MKIKQIVMLALGGVVLSSSVAMAVAANQSASQPNGKTGTTAQPTFVIYSAGGGSLTDAPPLVHLPPYSDSSSFTTVMYELFGKESGGLHKVQIVTASPQEVDNIISIADQPVVPAVMRVRIRQEDAAAVFKLIVGDNRMKAVSYSRNGDGTVDVTVLR